MENPVPFLIAKANAPVEDNLQLPEAPHKVNEEDALFWSIFHTRCGHPRHRDD